MEDWYHNYGNGLNKEIVLFGGSGLKHYYKSVAQALKSVYPEYPWDESRFQKPHKPHIQHKPQNYWSYLENQQAFFDDLADKLKIQKYEDWYNVSIQSIFEHGGRGMLGRYNGSLIKALATVYPNHNWKFYKYYSPHQKISKERVSKSQMTLQLTVRELFPRNAVILINHKHKDLPNKLEYDIYIPELGLAFEYQGEPHYFSIPIYGSLKQRQSNDKLKEESSKEMGITLICVPYWWNKTKESLAAFIRNVRSDIVFPNISKTTSISERPPQSKKIGETVFKLNPAETYNNDLAIFLFNMSNTYQ